MSKISFTITPCQETGGYVARWDDPKGGGIVTQGDTFGELDAMIIDAVSGYFQDQDGPAQIQLHFSEDPVLAVA
jgi:predicted RNase H-like HicB family nuclease